MQDYPWFGAGWEMVKPLYEHYYVSPKLLEGAAIQTNDILTVAATLGIPSFFCFVIYLWLSLTKKPESLDKDNEYVASLMRTVYRAGAVVLLVGFWFDGGLFELPTACSFWILLALGEP
jgi:hypothetical protein